MLPLARLTQPQTGLPRPRLVVPPMEADQQVVVAALVVVLPIPFLLPKKPKTLAQLVA